MLFGDSVTSVARLPVHLEGIGTLMRLPTVSSCKPLTARRRDVLQSLNCVRLRCGERHTCVDECEAISKEILRGWRSGSIADVGWVPDLTSSESYASQMSCCATTTITCRWRHESSCVIVVQWSLGRYSSVLVQQLLSVSGV